MAQAQIDEAKFRNIFEQPTIQRMLDELTDAEFEHFVQYVLQQAGYTVEYTAKQYGSGLDLKVFTGNTGSPLHAGVQVKHYSSNTLVTAPDMVKLKGGVSQNSGSVGYMVTTNGLNPAALAQADGPIPIYPIDGDHLMRYITYVRGTHPLVSTNLAHDNAPTGYSRNPISPEALFLADQVKRRPSATTKVLTLANHKGGVGKTTSALNLAFGLAGHNPDNQILLVDMDSQANLTRVLTNPQAQSAAAVHLGDYFAGRRRLSELVRPTQFKRVWLIPSDRSLTRSDTGVAAGPEAELRFVRDLHALDVAPPDVLDTRPFDWIILDTGPWMGFLTRSAIAASHYVLAPTAPSAFADMGLTLLLETVSTMQALMGDSIDILGCLVTQWQENALNKSLLASVQALLGLAKIPLLKTTIPMDKSNIEKAHLETGLGKRKTLLDRRCASARAYVSAVEEVLTYVH